MKITLENNVQLYYKKVGQGPNLILLHGNGEDHTIFTPLIARLQSHFTIYAIDTRCHGLSADVPFDSYDTLAEDIDLFVQALNLDKVHILGFSDGAIVATLLGIQNKAYLDRLILLGVNLNPHDIKEEWQTWIKAEYDKHHDPLVKLMMEEPNIPLADLEKINVPVLLFAADNDVMDLNYYYQIQEHITGSKLIIVENSDHLSYIVNNDMIADDVLSFLSNDE